MARRRKQIVVVPQTRWARFRGYAGRAWGRGRGIIGNIRPQIGAPFLIGAAAGYLGLTDKIPAEATLVAACVPLNGLGPVKSIAQGAILGNLIRNRFGGLPGAGGFVGI